MTGDGGAGGYAIASDMTTPYPSIIGKRRQTHRIKHTPKPHKTTNTNQANRPMNRSKQCTYAIRRVAIFATLFAFWGCSSSKKVQHTKIDEKITLSDSIKVQQSSYIMREIDENCVLDIIPMIVNTDGTLSADTTQRAARLVKASSMRQVETSHVDSTIIHLEQKERNTDEITETEKTRPGHTTLLHYWHNACYILAAICLLWLLVAAYRAGIVQILIRFLQSLFSM